ncbi:MAG: hypothetical protein IPK79_14130 [Vampirovibrionales bacterium]|nr:hypothetical protein [Vampirovibrionales bacterium]
MTKENIPELLKKAINCWESLRGPMVDSGIVDPKGIIPHLVIDAFFSGWRDGSTTSHDHKIQAATHENEMGKITIECDAGKVSDGYHTFDELYDHRCHLFAALMRSNPDISWRANNHEDGTMFDGWFVAGMHLPNGDISYHLPVSMWTLLDGKGIATVNKGPKWDGHTAADTVKRLAEWCVAGHDHKIQVTRIYGARGADVFAEGVLSTKGDLIKIEGSRDMEITPDEAARLGKELIRLARDGGWIDDEY